MWFKNLHLYRLHEAASVDAASLEAMLGEQAIRPLGGSEARRVGWAPPAGRDYTLLCHELQGQRLLTMHRQERVLPAYVVRDRVEENTRAIEKAESRKLRRQEKLALKEQAYEELLPQAFIRVERVDVWWDTRRDLVAVNAASRKKAEEALDLLRETLGSLKVTPLATQTLPLRGMTGWLGEAGKRPADMELGDTVTLMAKGDDGRLAATCVDLDSDEVQQLLASGRQASRLALKLEGTAAFVLHDDLAIKSLRFDDAVIDEASQADDGDDPVARLETDFLLMTQALARVVERLTDWLGGEAGQGAPQPIPSHQPSNEDEVDELLKDTARYVAESGKASVSSIQRQFKVGYNRAARLVEALEARGIVSPMNAQGQRRVLATLT